MRQKCLVVGMVVASVAWSATRPRAAQSEAARRGEQALLGRAFTPPFWTRPAYDRAWRQWEGDLKSPPADYAAKFRQRYDRDARLHRLGDATMIAAATRGTRLG